MIKLASEVKPRKLYDIDVDEITICASAANRKSFFIMKQDKEIIAAVADYFGKGFDIGQLEKTEDNSELLQALKDLAEWRATLPEDALMALDVLAKTAASAGMAEADAAELEGGLGTYLDDDEVVLEKAVDKKELAAALAVLKTYEGDFPDALKEAINTLVEAAAAPFVEAKEEEVKKAGELDEKDPWARLPLAVPAHMLPDEPEEEPEEENVVDELDYDPVIGPLRRIEKRLAGENETEIEDPWPSLWVPNMAAPAVVKTVAKADEEGEEKPVKKSLDSEENSTEIKKEKTGVVDNYPSLPDSLFEK